MTQAQVVTVMQDAILTVLVCSLPMVLVGLVIGVIVSIFQAATQINEQTLAFVPKIIGILLTLLICTGFLVSTLTDFVTRVYGYINAWLL